MGAQSSNADSAKSQNSSDTLSSPLYYPFLGSLSHPYFYCEKYLSDFFFQSMNDGEFHLHTPLELSNILLGCPAQIQNVDEVLEEIIVADSQNVPAVVNALSRNFKKYISLANDRNLSFYMNSRYDDEKYVGKSEAIAFKNILQSIGLSLDMVNPNIKSTVFYQTIKFFEKIPPILSISAPWKVFFPPNTDVDTQFLDIRNLIPHGLSSNGQFVFLLSAPDQLYIFPILNNGIISSPKIVILNFLQIPIKENACLIALPNRIEIYAPMSNGAFLRVEIMIKSLLEGKISANDIKISDTAPFLCRATDGISNVVVYPQSYVTVVVDSSQTNYQQKQVKLRKSSIECAPQFKELFRKDINYNLIPVETNGACFSFSYLINQHCALYRTFSLLTGEHMGDELYEITTPIYAMTIDSVNRCRWCLTATEGRRVAIQKVRLMGGINPYMIGMKEIPIKNKNSSQEKFFSVLNTHLRHLCYSQIYPSFLLCENSQILFDFLLLSIEQNNEIAIQTISILISININYYKTNNNNEVFKHKFFEILDKITSAPYENLLIFLFAPNFSYLFNFDPKYTTNLLAKIILLTEDDRLLSFILKHLEKSNELAFINFDEENDFKHLLPKEAKPLSSYPRSVSSLLLLHQRVLVRVTIDFLKNNPYAPLPFETKQQERTILDNLRDYTQEIIQSMVGSQDAPNLHNSLLFMLFNNMMRVLSPLVKYHSIASLHTALLPVLLDALIPLIDKDRSFFDDILPSIFIFGMFSATLIIGGELTDFEKKFLWVIKSNINLLITPNAIDSLVSPNVEFFQDFRFNSFLENTTALDQLYIKYKPQQNKRLNDDKKYVDRLSILAFAKQMKCLDELFSFNETKTPSESLKSSMDQAIRVRNKYIQFLQEKKTNTQDMLTKALMLIRMPDRTERDDIDMIEPRKLGDFVISDFSPQQILKIIKMQDQRIITTLNGFALINKLYKKENNQLFRDIIEYTLSSIDSFEGLSSVMKISKLTENQEDKISMFLNQVIDSSNKKIRIVAYRFFKSVKSLQKVKMQFLSGILNKFDNTKPVQMSLFALAYSLISSINSNNNNNNFFNTTTGMDDFNIEENNCYFPEKLRISENVSLFKLCLIEVASRRIPVPQDVIGSLLQTLWSSIAINARVILNTLFNVIEKITSEYLPQFFVSLFETVGNEISQETEIATAAEIILFVRRILELGDSHKVGSFLSKMIIDIFSKEQNPSDLFTMGVFAVLGYQMETPRPYTTVRVNVGMNSSELFFITPGEKCFNYYHKPFNISVPPIREQFPKGTMMTVISDITLTNFNHYDFIKKLLERNLYSMSTSPMILPLCFQVFSNFCLIPEFVSTLDEDFICSLGKLITPFSNMWKTTNKAKRFTSISESQENGIFGTMISNETISYVSPPIIRNSPIFFINFTILKGIFNGFFGIISDSLCRSDTRVSLISYPKGISFPENEIITSFTDSVSIAFEVNMVEKQFSVNGKTIDFPIGDQFKIFISAHINASIDIGITAKSPNPNIQLFDIITLPSFMKVCIEDDLTFATFPNNKDPSHKLKEDISQFSEAPVRIDPMVKSKKVRANYMQPFGVATHISNSSSASRSIRIRQFSGMWRKLANQWATLSLVRIANINPGLVSKLSFKLFSILCVPLEMFNRTEFGKGNFPFSLDHPAWVSSKIFYLSVESEMKKALIQMTNNEKCVKKIAKGIRNMSNCKACHLCALPNGKHHYLTSSDREIRLSENTQCIITFNDFGGMTKDAAETQTSGVKIDFPLILSDSSQITSLRIDPKYIDRDLSILSISPSLSNGWVYNTTLELFILIKNFTFFVKTPENRALAKTVLLDAFMVQSPFVLRYLSQFLDFIQYQITTSPFDNINDYINKLLNLGGYLKACTNPEEGFVSFYQNEQRILSSQFAINAAAYFPEFFEIPLPPTNSKLIQIPVATVDPGAINTGFLHHILKVKTFFRPYSTLKTFPFWEILPLWFRISGIWAGPDDYIAPTMKKIEANIIRITNHSRQAQIVLSKKNRIPLDIILMYSTNMNFEDAVIIPYSDILLPITIQKGVTYISAIANGIQRPWDDLLNISTRNSQSKQILQPESVDVTLIKNAFIEDMESFGLHWKAEHTERLLSLLNPKLLHSSTFEDVAEVARSSSLCAIFPHNVVLLRALLIHHFNFIRYFHYSSISDTMWNSSANLIHIDDASANLLSSFISIPFDRKNCVKVKVDRRLSQSLINSETSSHSGKLGEYQNSMISQIAQIIKTKGADKFRMCQKPWFVEFVGEQAIDAGGPTRELFYESITSIFEPTSLLFIKANCHHETYFIPNPMAVGRQDEFFAIGVLIGIIIRTGFLQEIPFAPFIWKFIAGEVITYEDIAEADEGLIPFFNNIKTGTLITNWIATDWHDRHFAIPGHKEGVAVKKEEITEFFEEFTRFRVFTIYRMLNLIRLGFIENTGISSHPMLRGKVLSQLSQGNGTISVEELKVLTTYSGFEGGVNNDYIKIFWRAVRNFNEEQLSLLLKFITTLTRLPNTAIEKDFKIVVDPLNCRDPNATLPTASTCFNKLHLPLYTNEDIAYSKILYAVQFCQTMENK